MLLSEAFIDLIGDVRLDRLLSEEHVPHGGDERKNEQHFNQGLEDNTEYTQTKCTKWWKPPFWKNQLPNVASPESRNAL